jgi:hypothetical protein
MVSDVGQIVAIPQEIQDIGRKAIGLATEISGIISAGSSYLQLAGSGNQGFLTTPAMAALTAAQIAALKNLGGLMDEHGRDMSGAASVYATTEQSIVTASTPTDGSMPTTTGTVTTPVTTPGATTPGTTTAGTTTPGTTTPGTTTPGTTTPGTTTVTTPAPVRPGQTRAV